MAEHDIPEPVADLLGRPMFTSHSDEPIQAGTIRLFAAAVEDGHPAYWAEDTSRMIAPPALLSAWNRPLPWVPAGVPVAPGLALHFLVKERLGLPRAVVTRTETEIGVPQRPGMIVMSEQTLISVSAPRANRLGKGRYWTIRVDYHCAASGETLGAEILGFFGYGGSDA